MLISSAAEEEQICFKRSMQEKRQKNYNLWYKKSAAFLYTEFFYTTEK